MSTRQPSEWRQAEWQQMNDPVIAAFRANGGIVPGRRGRVLLVTTTGARSGQPRLTPLYYTTDGERLVVIASKGAAPTHPAWSQPAGSPRGDDRAGSRDVPGAGQARRGAGAHPPVRPARGAVPLLRPVAAAGRAPVPGHRLRAARLRVASTPRPALLHFRSPQEGDFRNQIIL